jgi:signal transduction histidine kinase
MFRAALLNVLINACQAGGSDPIDVSASVERNVCRISIADRGAGVPDHIRDRVFEPFFTTRATGTGLGLAIVRRLIESQDGTVTLHERSGGGTVAELTLPLATSGGAPEPS